MRYLFKDYKTAGPFGSDFRVFSVCRQQRKFELSISEGVLLLHKGCDFPGLVGSDLLTGH